VQTRLLQLLNVRRVDAGALQAVDLHGACRLQPRTRKGGKKKRKKIKKILIKYITKAKQYNNNEKLNA
jgi:hypothetical protein